MNNIILFSNKTIVPPMFKAVAKKFKGLINFLFISDQQK